LLHFLGSSCQSLRFGGNSIRFGTQRIRINFFLLAGIVFLSELKANGANIHCLLVALSRDLKQMSGHREKKKEGWKGREREVV